MLFLTIRDQQILMQLFIQLRRLLIVACNGDVIIIDVIQGEATTTTPCVKKHIIQVSTHQMCILDLFNTKSSVTFQVCMELVRGPTLTEFLYTWFKNFEICSEFWV